MNEPDPPWRELLDVLDRALGPEEIAQDRRYSWSIRGWHRRLEVELWQEMLGARGRFGQKRKVSLQMILEGLPPAELEQDRRAIALLEEELDRKQWEEAPHKDRVSETTGRRMILALAGHPRVFWPQTSRGRDDGTSIEIEADRLALFAEEDLHGAIQLSPVLEKSGRPRPDLTEQCTRRIPANIIIELDEDTGACRAIELTAEARRLLHSLRGKISFPREARLAVLQRLPRLAKHLPVLRDSGLSGTRVFSGPMVLVRVGPLGIDGIRVSVLIRPAPGLLAVKPGSGAQELYGMSKDGGLIWTQRDLFAEKTAANVLISSLPPLARNANDERTVFDLGGDDALEMIGLLERKPDLETEWVEGTWRPTIKNGEPEMLRLVVHEHRDWFLVNGGLKIDTKEVRLAALLEAVRDDHRHLKLSGDEWVAISDALAVQLRRIEDLWAGGEEEVELASTAPLVLSDLATSIGELQTSARWRRAIERAGEELQAPKDLRAELRPYQLEGYRWLMHLAELGLGACLADDMGLGKTIQAIAVLSARGELGPTLIVAPTSIAFNWKRELERFLPKMKVSMLREVPPPERRPHLDKCAENDVVIASYELAMREIEALGAQTFATLILDEAQAVKNADTDRSRAMRRLDARWRLAMTGTPVENNAGELWSIFRVISPGLLGSWEQFRRRFLLPIEENSAERRRALANMIRPFVLRRRKAEVAPELPPKTEVQVDVILSAEERRRYHSMRLASLAQLLEETRNDQEQRFVVLAAITRLRQLACHPRLVDADWNHSSSKLETAVELLKQLHAEGHRALVFSQFTTLLDLLEPLLEREKLSFIRLDGTTPAAVREHRVRSFQEGTATAFLLSLKAGGTGLNLTAADYVLHLDPWWNPAAEDQATDRAHRIGQERPLTVYRLIAKETIEEQMLAVHAAKRELVRDLFEGTDTAAKLNLGELIEMIKASDSDLALYRSSKEED